MTASAPDSTSNTLLGRTGTEPVELRASQALVFVRELAGRVSGKQIELPSCPEAVLTHGGEAPDLLPAQLPADQAAIRLGVNGENCGVLLQEIAVAIDSLRSAIYETR
jgi:hypothetical protein